jgi:nitrite reductase (NADH) small subunit/3-phenylpropionate/trans-cinnamate dioxygenase ferredoxin subunit
MIALFLRDGKYWAIDDFCPHQGASLAEGYLEECTVACSWHYWRFSLTDGSWVDNPKIKVQTYPVRVKQMEIQIQIPTEAGGT